VTSERGSPRNDRHAGPPSIIASEANAATIVTTSLKRMLVDGKSAADAVAQTP
jgi:hypothetical protein